MQPGSPVFRLKRLTAAVGQRRRRDAAGAVAEVQVPARQAGSATAAAAVRACRRTAVLPAVLENSIVSGGSGSSVVGGRGRRRRRRRRGGAGRRRGRGCNRRAWSSCSCPELAQPDGAARGSRAPGPGSDAAPSMSTLPVAGCRRPSRDRRRARSRHPATGTGWPVCEKLGRPCCRSSPRLPPVVWPGQEETWPASLSLAVPGDERREIDRDRAQVGAAVGAARKAVGRQAGRVRRETGLRPARAPRSHVLRRRRGGRADGLAARTRLRRRCRSRTTCADSGTLSDMTPVAVLSEPPAFEGERADDARREAPRSGSAAADRSGSRSPCSRCRGRRPGWARACSCRRRSQSRGSGSSRRFGDQAPRARVGAAAAQVERAAAEVPDRHVAGGRHHAARSAAGGGGEVEDHAFPPAAASSSTCSSSWTSGSWSAPPSSTSWARRDVDVVLEPGTVVVDSPSTILPLSVVAPGPGSDAAPLMSGLAGRGHAEHRGERRIGRDAQRERAGRAAGLADQLARRRARVREAAGVSLARTEHAGARSRARASRSRAGRATRG